MKKNPYQNVPTKKLLQKRKMMQTLNYAQIGVVVLLLIVGIWSYFEKGFDIISVMWLFFAPMILVNFLTIKGLTKEIDSRDDV